MVVSLLPAEYENLQGFISLPTIVMVNPFKFNYTSEYVVLSSCSFNLHSLITNEPGQILHLLAILLASSHFFFFLWNACSDLLHIFQMDCLPYF